MPKIEVIEGTVISVLRSSGSIPSSFEVQLDGGSGKAHFPLDDLNAADASAIKAGMKIRYYHGLKDNSSGHRSRVSWFEFPATFENADFYDDPEEQDSLHCRSPEEYIKYLVGLVGKDYEEVALISPIEVGAYVRKKDSKTKYIKSAAVCLVDHAIELWDEDNDVSSPHDAIVVSKENIEKARKQMESVLEALFEGHEPWHCDMVAVRTYTYEEVLEILKCDTPA
jgi:hypothetical protein